MFYVLFLFFVFCFCLSCHQPGMHVNGAPQMMQPPNMGVVPGPMPGPGPGPGTGPGPGPAPGPVGPPGRHQTACIITSSTGLVMVGSSLCSKHYVGHQWLMCFIAPVSCAE